MIPHSKASAAGRPALGGVEVACGAHPLRAPLFPAPRSAEYLEAKVLELEHELAAAYRQIGGLQDHIRALEAEADQRNALIFRQAALHFAAQRVIACWEEQGGGEEQEVRLAMALNWLREALAGRPAPKYLPAEWLKGGAA